jgi:flagellar FliL protein
LAEENENAGGAAPKSGKKRVVILIVLALLVLGGGGGAAWFFLLSDTAPTESEAETAAEAEQPAARAEALYVALDPAFVINFHDANDRRRFLKAELSVVTRDPETEAALIKHMPMVRNALVLLFSRQVYEDLVPHEGKEALRAQARDEIAMVLSTEAGSADVEDVLFTSFVMQ